MSIDQLLSGDALLDIAEKEQAIWDMKQELEDYLEEQGIYIRQ